MPSTIPHDPSQPQPDKPADPQHAAELGLIADMLTEGLITVSEAATRRYKARLDMQARIARPRRGDIPAAAAAFVESLLPPADTRAAVAKALLGRWFAVDQVLGDEAAAMLGNDAARLAALESDPRYLIGRLQQALTALLERDIPAPDVMERLMYAALDDAIEYRLDRWRNCGCGTPACDRCGPDFVLSVRYDSLVRELGLMGPDPLTPAGEEARAARSADRAALAELAARITAGAAARADFGRERDAYTAGVSAGPGRPVPDWATWAGRLSLALAGLLDVLAARR